MNESFPATRLDTKVMEIPREQHQDDQKTEIDKERAKERGGNDGTLGFAEGELWCR